MYQFAGILAFLFVFIILITYIVMHIMSTSTYFKWVPDASLLMFAGLISALLYRLIFYDWSYEFNASFFYYVLLPPIIFNSGLDIDRICFRKNFVSIMVYANIGTLINAIAVCVFLYLLGVYKLSSPISLAEGITFGALISATDPVTTLAVFDRLKVETNLFGIIVGVSILDDAVSVIIFELFNGLIGDNSLTIIQCFILFLEFLGKFVGSIIVGYFLGFVFHKVLKFNSGLHSKTPQLIAMATFFVYLCYFTGEAFWLSGIIITLFSAISFKKYHENTYPAAFGNVKVATGTIAYLLESLVFILIGLSLTAHPLQSTSDWTFFAWSLVACLLGRALQIYPLAWVLNLYNTIEITPNPPPAVQHLSPTIATPDHVQSGRTCSIVSKICNSLQSFCQRGVNLSRGYQHMMFLAGLRGPIAYATAQLFNNARGHNNLIAGTTAMTVIFTTFVLGLLTWPALNWFSIPHDVQKGSGEVIPVSFNCQCLSESCVNFLADFFTIPNGNGVEYDIDGLTKEKSQLNSFKDRKNLVPKKTTRWHLLSSNEFDDDTFIQNPVILEMSTHTVHSNNAAPNEADLIV